MDVRGRSCSTSAAPSRALAHVGAVLHQPPRLGDQTGSAPLALSRLGNRLAGGLGARHTATARDLIERVRSVTTEPQG